MSGGKPLVCLKAEIKSPPFSTAARLEAGKLLRRLQRGDRPMPTVGPRCHELRIVDADKSWRIIHRVDSDAIVAGGFVSMTRTLAMRCDMKAQKKKRLEAAGWWVGSTKEFLDLSAAEDLLVEIHLSLSETLRERRLRAKITQTDLAKRLGSSQSRVAKMELGDSSVSIELLIRALFALGASKRDVAAAIGRRVA